MESRSLTRLRVVTPHTPPALQQQHKKACISVHDIPYILRTSYGKDTCDLKKRHKTEMWVQSAKHYGPKRRKDKKEKTKRQHAPVLVELAQVADGWCVPLLRRQSIPSTSTPPHHHIIHQHPAHGTLARQHTSTTAQQLTNTPQDRFALGFSATCTPSLPNPQVTVVARKGGEFDTRGTHVGRASLPENMLPSPLRLH